MKIQLLARKRSLVAAIVLAALLPTTTGAFTSADGSFEMHGYIDNTMHYRFGENNGVSKERVRGQLEFSKYFQPVGLFSEISLHGILRASYDGAYDINDDTWGDEAGRPVTFESQGGPALGLPNRVPWGATANPALGAVVLPATNPFASPTSPHLNGFFLGTSPNEGLRILGAESFNGSGGIPGFGGVQLAFPVRPCDVDPRGCIDDYMDLDEDDLRFPEFNDRADALREIYIDATIPFDNGDEINFRVGRQQVVWGRTDLFRVLDQVNPIDFSIQNIYEEFEDSRIPMGIFSAEYRAGATNIFDDINFQFIWKFEKFRPHTLGQGGQPYSILDAGNLFRALSTCWHFGCTVANFAPNSTAAIAFDPPIGPGAPAAAFPLGMIGNVFTTGLLATTFPAHTIGIRRASLPDGDFEDQEFGIRLEGVFKSVGFSFNALYFHSQLPSLRGGTAGPPAINPFLAQPGAVFASTANPGLLPPGGIPANVLVDPASGAVLDSFGNAVPRPYLIAFDIHFPRVMLLGASADFYIDAIKSTFRVEVAHTNGEEFANTLSPRLFSESNVVRWVVGWDRQTYIRPLNPNRTFLLSAQIFGQHILEHEEETFGTTLPSGRRVFSKAGFADWEHGFIGTFLIQGFYKNDQVVPRIITAYDFRAHAGVVAPRIDWLISDNWRLIVGANIKFGRTKNEFDDCRVCNPFPPFTDPTAGVINALTGVTGPGQTAARIGGMTPLGAFRSGPIGMAQDEDELQILLRWRF